MFNTKTKINQLETYNWNSKKEFDYLRNHTFCEPPSFKEAKEYRQWTDRIMTYKMEHLLQINQKSRISNRNSSGTKKRVKIEKPTIPLRTRAEQKNAHFNFDFYQSGGVFFLPHDSRTKNRRWKETSLRTQPVISTQRKD